MEKKYIAFDIETSGSSPGKYSMLSLGACLVDDPSITFYREIKPINRNFILEAMKISCKGLRCLSHIEYWNEYNGEDSNFNPSKILDILYDEGEHPIQVMKDYGAWVLKHTEGYKPIEAASPIKFDGSFTLYYFDNFNYGRNPFRHTGEDINSMYRGVTGNVNANIEDLGLRPKELPHNALEDAIIQAKEFAKVLSLMRK